MVGLISDKSDVVPFHCFLELKGPGTHGVSHNIFPVLLDRCRGDHITCVVGERAQDHRRRVLQGEFHRSGINDFDGLDVFDLCTKTGLCFRIQSSFQHKFHCLGVKIGAVMEFHVLF